MGRLPHGPFELRLAATLFLLLLGVAWGTVAVAGGLAMGLVYTVVLILTLQQCWLSRPPKETPDA